MSILLEEARRLLDAQPFSVLLGTELNVFEEGRVELALPIREELKQQHGFVHGGVISYLADNALTGAGASVLGPAVVTSEYKINYVRPAIGGVLIARAAVVSAGRRQAVCRCDVLVRQNGEEKLCAVAQGTIVRLEGEAEKPATAGSRAVLPHEPGEHGEPDQGGRRPHGQRGA